MACPGSIVLYQPLKSLMCTSCAPQEKCGTIVQTVGSTCCKVIKRSYSLVSGLHRPKSCGPELYCSWIFMHKSHVLVDTLQLARTVSNKQSYGRQKIRLVYLRTFPKLSTMMDWIFALILADFGVYMLGSQVRMALWCLYHVSVMLRSRDLFYT